MQISVQAVLKTAMVIGTGANLKYYKQLSKRSISELSALAVRVLLPCYLVASMSHSISFHQLHALVVLPVFALAHHLIGLLVGYVLVMAASPWNCGLAHHRHIAIVAHAFFNSSGLPLSLLPSIIHASPALSRGDPRAALTHGSMCVIIYSILNKVGIWTFARHLMRSSNEDSASKGSPHSMGDDGIEAGLPLDGGRTKYRPRRTRGIVQRIRNFVLVSGGLAPSIKFCVRVVSEQRIIASTIVGLTIALTPRLNDLFYAEDASLAFMMQAAQYMGNATFALLMITLGANLASSAIATGAAGGAGDATSSASDGSDGGGCLNDSSGSFSYGQKTFVMQEWGQRSSMPYFDSARTALQGPEEYQPTAADGDLTRGYSEGCIDDITIGSPDDALDLNARELALVAVGRLVLVPLANTVLIKAAHAAGVLPSNDPVLVFVLLLQVSVSYPLQYCPLQ